MLRSGRAPCIVLPTGTGKTITAVALALRRHQRYGGPCLFVAPSTETVAQFERALERAGFRCYRDQAEHHAPVRMAAIEAQQRPVAVVASQQTLAREHRVAAYPQEGWALKVIDEAHHTPAATWLGVIEHFSGPWLALTATPQRRGMSRLWTAVTPFAGGVRQAIEEGWLVPPMFRHVVLPQPLSEALSTADARKVGQGLPRPLRTVQRLLGDGQGLVFWPSVTACKQAAKWLASAGGISAALHGKLDPDERTRIVDGFRAGDIRLLHAYGVGIEGLDLPSLDRLMVFRRTTLLQTAQMLGRALRTAPGVLDGLSNASAEERQQAIAASIKPEALIVTCSSPDDSDLAMAPQRLLHGDLPPARLIEIIAASMTGVADADGRKVREAEDLERRITLDERRRELEQKAAESLIRYRDGRYQALEAAEELRVLTPRQRRAQDLRISWQSWRVQARMVVADAERATTKQAFAIASLAEEYLSGSVDRPRIEMEVMGWPRDVARKAQHRLRMLCGRRSRAAPKRT